ncbi:MAG: GAF domain-containing protein [Chloroflexota bacterium]
MTIHPITNHTVSFEAMMLTNNRVVYDVSPWNTTPQIFELAEVTDITVFTHKALQLALHLFDAQAGAIYLQVPTSQWAESGDLPATIYTDIQKQKNALNARLQTGVWRVLDPTPEIISIQTYPDLLSLLVNIPLLKGTQVVGAINLLFPSSAILNDLHKTTLLELSQTIGPLSTLINETSSLRKQISELDLLHHTSQILTGTVDSQALLEKVITLTANVLDTDATSILLIDHQTNDLVFEVCQGPSSEYLHQKRIASSQGIAGWVVENQRPIIINDVSMAERFSRSIDVQAHYLTKTIAAVPLRIRGQVIGVLEAINKNTPDGFDKRDLRLLTSIAAQAAVALENARLYQNLRDEHEKIMVAKEQERQALARTDDGLLGVARSGLGNRCRSWLILTFILRGRCDSHHRTVCPH